MRLAVVPMGMERKETRRSVIQPPTQVQVLRLPPPTVVLREATPAGVGGQGMKKRGFSAVVLSNENADRLQADVDELEGPIPVDPHPRKHDSTVPQSAGFLNRRDVAWRPLSLIRGARVSGLEAVSRGHYAREPSLDMTLDEIRVAVQRRFLATISGVERRLLAVLLARAKSLRAADPQMPAIIDGYLNDPKQVPVAISVAFISPAVVPQLTIWHNKAKIDMGQRGSALAIVIHRKISSRLWDDLRLFQQGHLFVVGYVHALLPAINRRLLDNRYLSGHVYSRTYAVHEALGISIRHKNDTVRTPWPISALPFPRVAQFAHASRETCIRDYIDAVHAFVRNDFDDCIRRVITSTEDFIVFKKWKTAPPQRPLPSNIWEKIADRIRRVLRRNSAPAIPNTFKNTLRTNIRTDRIAGQVILENLLFIYHVRNRIVHAGFRLSTHSARFCRKSIATVGYLLQRASRSRDIAQFVFSVEMHLNLLEGTFDQLVDLDRLKLIYASDGPVTNIDSAQDLEEMMFSTLRFTDQDKSSILS